MKVWLVHLESYGETVVYNDWIDITKAPEVKSELDALVGWYKNERDEFLACVKNAVRRGRGSATIEERLRVELVEVNTF